MVKRTMVILMTISACSCSHLDLKGIFMPSGEGVEKRFEQSLEMNRDLNAGCVKAQENYIFYAAADPHIDQTRRNLEIFNDALRNDAEATLGVVLGDCTDDKDNLPEYLESLSYCPERHAFNHEIFHVLGNHDIFFNGWVDFKESVGPSVYWFQVDFDEGKDLFITLDTASGSLGRKQTDWLKSFLAANRKGYRHCIVLTHTNIFYTDSSQDSSGNLPIEESYALIDCFGKYDVSLVLQGHDHYREDLIFDNVRYTILGAINDKMETPEYAIVSVDRDGISFDWQTIME